MKYYLKLNRLLGTEAALVANPQMVRRWQERQARIINRGRRRLLNPDA